MPFGERLQGEAFLPESVNTNKDDRKAAVKVPDRVKQCRIRKEDNTAWIQTEKFKFMH